MECVRFAPSAVNKQPWMFRIKNEADKAKLQECYNCEWFETAEPQYNGFIFRYSNAPLSEKELAAAKENYAYRETYKVTK